MISLTDLRLPGVALDWHEAVAVAAALATLLDGAPAAPCPAPSDVELTPAGGLRVSGPGVVDGAPAQGVATVLALLLESAPCPAELRQIVDAFGGEAGLDDRAVGDLRVRLEFFERPDRVTVLSALAQRAAPAIERARSAAALEALTERTRQPSGPHDRLKEPKPRRAPSAAPASRASVEPPQDRSAAGQGRLLLAGVGVFALCLAVAFVAASWLESPTAEPPRAAAERPEDDLPITGPGLGEPAPAPRAPARPSNAPQVSPSAPGVPSPGSAATPPSPARPDPRVPRSDGEQPVAAPPAAPAPSATTPVDITVAERDGRALAPAVEPVRPPARTSAGRIFTHGDALVTPAVLVRPHLPEQPPPDVPEEQIGTLEFVVSDTGAVEHVHLISPANRYQERMLVAAAKTWVFRPATREGRPVRFRTRIRLTL